MPFDFLICLLIVFFSFHLVCAVINQSLNYSVF